MYTILREVLSDAACAHGDETLRRARGLFAHHGAACRTRCILDQCAPHGRAVARSSLHDNEHDVATCKALPIQFPRPQVSCGLPSVIAGYLRRAV